MSQQNIDFGSFPNDQNADAIRVAFQKVQNNFSELYSVIYQTGVSKILPGPGISVDQNTGNVTVTNRLNSLTVQTGSSLLVGISTATSNAATVNTSTTPLVINVSNTITTNTIVATSNLVGRLSANSANQSNITRVGTLVSLSVTGNVRANLFVGNISAPYINATAIDAPGANTQILYNQQGNIGALSTVTYNSVTNTLNVSGLVSTVGTITGANLRTGGSLSATGNINGGSILSLGNISATGNIIANTNLRANGTITTLGNGIFGNVRTAGVVSAAGNVIGDWFIGSLANGSTRINIPTANSAIDIEVGGTQNVVTITNSNTTITGNLSVTGRIISNSTANSSLTGNLAVSGQLNSGFLYSSGGVTVDQDFNSNGNAYFYKTVFGFETATFGNVRSSGLLSAAGNIFGNNSTLVGNVSVGNVGPVSYNPAASLNANGTVRCINVTGNGTLSMATVSATGNVIGASFIGSGSTLSNLTGSNVVGNVNSAVASFRATNITAATGDLNYSMLVTSGSNSSYFSGPAFNPQFGLLTATNFNASANVTANALVAPTVFTPSINAGSNIALGNITGNWQLTPGSRFTATYADLAEYYAGDSNIESGTVVEFGGEHEVTVCNDPSSTKVAGIVSTDPAYVMNGMIKCDFPTIVGLQGRVPAKVTGKINKGDMMVSAGNGRATACNSPIIGSVIGKALQDFEGAEGIIEIAIGRI
jgi:filamentous hemagglutinin